MKQMDTIDAQLQMRGLLMGFVVSRALQVAAELGVADALASGPKERGALAREVDADPATLHRLLRACASLDVFEELADGRYANTPRSEFLRTNVPGSMRNLAHMYGEAALGAWSDWVQRSLGTAELHAHPLNPDV
jgi:hypothetical protein